MVSFIIIYKGNSTKNTDYKSIALPTELQGHAQ